MTGRQRDGEAGVAVVLVLALVGALVVLAAVAAGLTAVVVAHRRAQAAADLAALAAAGQLQSRGDACAAATVIARRNGAELGGCSIDGSTAAVTVTLRLPPVLSGRDLRASARAGPVSGRYPALG